MMINQFFHNIYISDIPTILTVMPLLLLSWSVFGAAFDQRLRIPSLILSILAAAAILYVTVLSRGQSEVRIELIPFKLFEYAKENPELYRSMLMNVFLFMPLGLTLPFVWRGGIPKRMLLTVLFGLLLSVAVETIQYFAALGFSDMDDVICNTLGVAFGSCAYPLSRLWRRLFGKKSVA